MFFTIYDYLRFNPSAARQYNIFSTSDLDNLTCEDWKDAAEDAIYWLMHNQLPNVTVLDIEDESPSADTWRTLYYQTLTYRMLLQYPSLLHLHKFGLILRISC